LGAPSFWGPERGQVFMWAACGGPGLHDNRSRAWVAGSNEANRPLRIGRPHDDKALTASGSSGAKRWIDGARSCLRCRLVAQAPKLKSFSIDRLFDRIAGKLIRRIAGWPDDPGHCPGTMLLREPVDVWIAGEGPQLRLRLRLEHVDAHRLSPEKRNSTQKPIMTLMGNIS
jgi:hypothetical protein